VIAIAENGGSTVLLYHRLSSYINGHDPVGFQTGLTDTDAGLRELGWERSESWWRPTPGSNTVIAAAVRKIQ
jgi:hypothetical protein